MKDCQWWCTDPMTRKYHDEEWGYPVHDDRAHFGGLILERMQCGLSWNLVLRKREIFRACFADYNYEAVARFGEKDVDRILAAEGMIRSRRKVEAVIGNARAFLRIREEFGSFDRYIWGFTGNKTLVYPDSGLVSENGLSRKSAADLKKRGFRFVGGVTVYSYLQACGLINDHGPECPVYRRLIALGNTRYVTEDPEE